MAMAFDDLAALYGRLNRWLTDPDRSDDDVLTLTTAQVDEIAQICHKGSRSIVETHNRAHNLHQEVRRLERLMYQKRS